MQVYSSEGQELTSSRTQHGRPLPFMGSFYYVIRSEFASNKNGFSGKLELMEAAVSLESTKGTFVTRNLKDYSDEEIIQEANRRLIAIRKRDEEQQLTLARLSQETTTFFEQARGLLPLED